MVQPPLPKTATIVLVLGRCIVPYVRMTRRGKWVSARAQQYLASQAYLRLLIRNEMNRQGIVIFPPTPLSVTCIVQMSGNSRRGDLQNIVKAIHDAANGVLWPDDRWIDHEYNERRFNCETDSVILEVSTL